MKHFFHFACIKLAVMLVLAFLSRIAFGQASLNVAAQPADVQSHDIVITYHKTTSMIFPAHIKSVDRGSRDIIARKAFETGNVLQLKANRENFPETNLTVITSDGVLHQFTINYHKDPEKLSLDLSELGIPVE